MRLRSPLLLATAALLASMGSAHAAATDEWASSVLGFSTQWGTGTWAAAQALGAPDTFAYGDIGTAWAAAPKNGSLEFLSLGFATPTYSTGAVVRETYGNGFVYQVDAIDAQGGLHTVWTGTDTSVAGAPVDFSLSWNQTAFKTVGLKIYVNGDHDLNAWEEIDAVRLVGNTTAPVPEPSSYALLLAGAGLLGLVARRRQPR
ncbi:PEP-CTERM sorting domain-containing protein [Roseateles sp. NT4]|uniref:PEP-CTERM sorting domain-containing protein n=1 Tax=Roseateles sp. NT4 TaxID=3453715 RepID=UPI003EE82CD2